MHTVLNTAGQPGAPSCSEGQQAIGDEQPPCALIFELVGLLLSDVAMADKAIEHLEEYDEQAEHVEPVRRCAAVARQLAAFLADYSRDQLTGQPHGLSLDDLAGYLLSPRHAKALSTVAGVRQ